MKYDLHEIRSRAKLTFTDDSAAKVDISKAELKHLIDSYCELCAFVFGGLAGFIIAILIALVSAIIEKHS